MQKPNRKWLFLMMVIVSLVASGCAGTGVEGAAQQGANPTVVIVQYVTQVVATVTPAPPTATPLPITPEVEVPSYASANGFDPFKVDIYYPLRGCQIASRIHTGERVYAADSRNGTLSLHMSANIGDAPIFRKVDPGEVLDVIEGPFCRDLSLVWKVIGADGQEGFVAEGNGNNYWLLPLGEKVAADKMNPKKKPDYSSMFAGAKIGSLQTCGR